MASWRLVVGLAFALASSAVFFYAGLVQLRRQVLGEARLALQLFAVWWFSLAALTVSGAVLTVLANFGVTDLALWQVYIYLAIGAICLALWGLLYYLLYLFTGHRGWFTVLSIFYGLVYVMVLYVIQTRKPTGVLVEEWGAELQYAREAAPALGIALLLVIVLPQILAGLAYFSLFFRVSERGQRYRIALVSWSIVTWFGTSLVGGALPQAVRDTDAWHILTRTIGLAAASLIIMAYKPPARIRRWLEAETDGREGKGLAAAQAPIRKTRSIAEAVQAFAENVADMFRPRPVGALF